MKYENLMDIPWGYEMQLTEAYENYPEGTKIARGHVDAYADDEESVSFTFPDGEWDYLYKDLIEDIPKEYKGMKGSDRVMVELTGYQVATLWALLGNTQSGNKNNALSLFIAFNEILSADPSDVPYQDQIEFGLAFEENLYKAVLEPETPILTEVQKKALELKETIAKAQKQLEELEKEI